MFLIHHLSQIPQESILAPCLPVHILLKYEVLVELILIENNKK